MGYRFPLFGQRTVTGGLQVWFIGLKVLPPGQGKNLKERFQFIFYQSHGNHAKLGSAAMWALWVGSTDSTCLFSYSTFLITP